MPTNGSRDLTGGARDTLRNLQGRMSEGMDELRDYAGSADAAVRKLARERPLLTIACAAGIGFLIGRLASRT
jgi:ElaB/YqjD/DUF883 family membrane-anchored ribosome-binding protein